MFTKHAPVHTYVHAQMDEVEGCRVNLTMLSLWWRSQCRYPHVCTYNGYYEMKTKWLKTKLENFVQLSTVCDVIAQ